VHADDKLSAFVELERQALTVTFYLESIHADRGTADLRSGYAVQVLRLVTNEATDIISTRSCTDLARMLII
jgi:hypothetical protein